MTPWKSAKKFPLFFLPAFFGVGAIAIWQGTVTFWHNLVSTFTPTVVTPAITDSYSLLQQIRSVGHLVTTVFSMETIVPASSQRVIGKWVIGETKLLYLARGEVKAGIDLSQLQPQHLQVTGDRITIQLPPPQILDSKIDVNNSRVYHYDRGFLNLGPDNAPQLQALAQQHTLQKITVAACQQDILTQANEKAVTIVEQLLKNSGYNRVEVKTSPSSCPLNSPQ
ncbi:MAG: DUF4230 domain-containing protein [Geminocystis sp.]|nr:DUF4230 domain-containing protein [Geminocystis sp.]HIK38577.1 DUF4230 domain-containing protein [Geminocystis sp. M7585_C2015_104]MCS7147334.1 DUF4230 domain-containing protein [Geminocystis sp.]MCX8079084.1 DUF4230 domain-containing protein [Geminocystis sp.]MDW8116333.1 DUF4230 domain-containing protein [Geminocystis sp.]